nr:ribonuclease H-like domain-containing protein [Tanacetum cinerariifolium]
MVVVAKLPVLNPSEFELWKMRIEQYFLMTDYALWEVIVNGDSPPPKRTVNGVEQTYPPTTIEEKAPRENMNREPVRRNVTVETTDAKALVAQNRIGYDWSDHSPPYTGNFMPPKLDLILADVDEYVVSESITSVPAVATNEAKTSESKPKSVSKPIIKDWVSDSEDKNETKTKSKQRKPSFAKADEGFFVGYYVNSKAFRVFNSRTRIVEETLHITFLENKPNVVGSGPTWIFDIDTLTKSMNYKPVIAGNQSNGSTGKARVKTVPDKDYILLPLCTQDPLFSSSSKDSTGDGFKPSRDEENKDAKDPWNEDNEVLSTEEPRVNQEKDANVNNTNNINFH